MSRTASAALTVYDDPRAKFSALRQLYGDWASTNAVPAQVRPAVARAWQRRTASNHAVAEPLPESTVAGRRESNGGLRDVLPILQGLLLDVAEQAGNELVVCDADAVVLWLKGPRTVRQRSERLGFVEGACWAEPRVGANALGTSLLDETPVQIFGPEHTDEGHHGWVCTGAPIMDPVRGTPLGAITLSGPLVSAHPNTLALVSAAVKVAEESLRSGHRQQLHRLARTVAGLSGPHLLVDPAGWVAASAGFRVGEQVWVPGTLSAGPVWLPNLGGFSATEVDGGWLLRPQAGQGRTLILTDSPEPAAILTGAGTGAASTGRGAPGDQDERIPLSRRHLQILQALAAHPTGLSARALAVEVYGCETDTVTVRAEISRLRRRLGPMIAARPYRLTVPATLTTASSAPASLTETTGLASRTGSVG